LTGGVIVSILYTVNGHPLGRRLPTLIAALQILLRLGYN
jgi:hypothetical protein